MPGNPLVRFDEGRVGRTRKVSPSLLLYWLNLLFRNLLGLCTALTASSLSPLPHSPESPGYPESRPSYPP
jgi:hypothetical protein